jgi:hypothetical protein
MLNNDYREMLQCLLEEKVRFLRFDHEQTRQRTNPRSS